jgi:hypothetical protein
METYYAGSAENIQISIRLPDVSGSLRDIGRDADVPYLRDGDYVTWTADRIGDFAMYTLSQA